MKTLVSVSYDARLSLTVNYSGLHEKCSNRSFSFTEILRVFLLEVSNIANVGMSQQTSGWQGVCDRCSEVLFIFYA